MFGVATGDVVVGIVSAFAGSSALGVLVKWSLNRLNRENTSQHMTSLGTLREVRDTLEAMREDSNERFKDISNTIRVTGALSESLHDKVQAMGERLDEAIHQWDISRAKILSRLEIIEDEHGMEV